MLIETAERADAIDKDRAIKAKENATTRLAQLSKEDAEFEIMSLALARAINRISVAEKLSLNCSVVIYRKKAAPFLRKPPFYVLVRIGYPRNCFYSDEISTI